MNFKKMAAALTAAACCATALPNAPFEFGKKTFAAEIVKNDFETSYEGWFEGAENVKVEALYGVGVDNSRGMYVSNRLLPSDGASSQKGYFLGGGIKYDYSVMVYSETPEVFHLTLDCIDETTGEHIVKDLVTQSVAGGEWTELSAECKTPASSTDFKLTINNDSINDFYFDDVLITQQVKKNTSMTADAAANGLKDVWGGYFRVGNILNGGTVNNSGIKNNLLKDCTGIECENETKPDATLVQSQCSGTNIGVSLSRCAAIFDFCDKNGLGVRGHTLVWHSQTPEWFFKENFNQNGGWVSSSVMDQRMESYIKNMFGTIAKQYPNLDLYAYDVCNECISDDSNRTSNGKDGAREAGIGNGKSPWVQVYGNNSFIEKAFTYARKYAPEGCDLYYNDYNEYWDHKRDCIYNMAKNLYNKGLLDGVGMQSHINADYNGFSGVSSYITAMKKYLSIGCDVQVTELDVSVENGKFSDNDQATKYYEIFKTAAEINQTSTGGKVTAVCVWGPNDANSWLKSGSNGLLYNSNNQPKAAYNKLMSYPNPKPASEFNPSHVVTPIEPAADGSYFHSTFEGSTTGWSGRGSATIMTSGRTAYEGSESLLVQDRESAWNGASYAISANPFKPGETFSFSADVMYYDGGATDTFYMKLEYTDSNGDACYDPIAEAEAVQGEWVQLANPNYKIPSDATDMKVYIETADSTNNFYVDDVYGAKAGTVYNGPKAKKIMRGDVDFSGDVDVFDIAAARQVWNKDMTGAEKTCADVTQNSKVNEMDISNLSQFVTGKISEFEKEKPVIDMDALKAKFGSVNLASSLKKDGENNPLYTQRFGADPGFMVYKDRLYVYTTNDAFEYNGSSLKENSYDVGTINCCSSADLVNWTDHGAIPVAGRNGRTQNGVAKWASCSWAPDACWKTINGKDKFFLYFANSGGGIGVLTADSPTGPWSDPLGHALLTGSSPNCKDVVWMFDPGVMVDDDGTGYLFFGGGVDGKDKSNPGTGRCVKLGADMISLAENPVKMSTPYLFEDSSICKIGSTYYYSYCSNWNVPGGTSINGQSFGSGDICYMTSSSPLGPYTFGGRAFANTGGQGLDKGGNNHHSIVEFKGKLYVLYHTRVVENRMNINQNYRSPSISEASMSNGKITCQGSHKGVAQLELLNPYEKVQAETMSNQSGMVDQSTPAITVNGVGDTVVSSNKSGAWTKVAGVDFSKGASTITVRASSKNGCVIKVCAGSPSGEAVTYVEVPAGGSMSEITVPIVGSLGSKSDLCFVFNGQAEFDWWKIA